MNNKNLVQLQYKYSLAIDGHCPFFKAIFEKSSLLLKQEKKKKKGNHRGELKVNEGNIL